MTYTSHGNLFGRAAPRSLPARRRFVALLDVLGMKSWLRRAAPDKIASAIDSAIGEAVAKSASRGQRIVGENGSLTIDVTTGGPHAASSGPIRSESYGPLVGVTHFSDTLLAWTPDDSWASLTVLSSAIELLLRVALTDGIPMRGAIAFGDAVCAPKEQRFVGVPIADAYLWAEKTCPYKGVGVSFTPATLELVRSMLPQVPAWCVSDFPQQVIETKEYLAGGHVAWFRETLMLDHWDATFKAGRKESALAKGKSRIEEILKEFLETVVNAPSPHAARATAAVIEAREARWAEMLRLDELVSRES